MTETLYTVCLDCGLSILEEQHCERYGIQLTHGYHPECAARIIQDGIKKLDKNDPDYYDKRMSRRAEAQRLAGMPYSPSVIEWLIKHGKPCDGHGHPEAA